MTPARKTPARKTTARKTPARKTPARKTPAARSSRRRDPDDEVDDLTTRQNVCGEDDEEPGRPTRRLSTAVRQKAELEAALLAKDGKPIFPFPPELPEKHKPYWTELVNSRPHDYFNRGDIPLLKLYARVAHDIDILDREIEENGDVINNARGNPVVNPKVLVRSIAETRLMALATKLRSQPASRYDSVNDKAQSEKVKKAKRAADAIMDEQGDGDDGDLLAGGGIRH